MYTFALFAPCIHFFYLCPSVIIPVCTWCGSLQIYQRGLPPGGGGKVYFSCPIVKRMKPLLLNEVGKVKRVRGVSYLLLLYTIPIFFQLMGIKYVYACFLS